MKITRTKIKPNLYRHEYNFGDYHVFAVDSIYNNKVARKQINTVIAMKLLSLMEKSK